MTLELIMNQDGVIDHDTGSITSNGTFTMITPASLKSKIEGKGIYKGPLAGIFAGGDATGFVPASVIGTFTIVPTAVFVKDDLLPVVRAGDTGTITAVGTIAPPATPPTGPVIGQCVVSDAGQGVVNAD